MHVGCTSLNASNSIDPTCDLVNGILYVQASSTDVLYVPHQPAALTPGVCCMQARKPVLYVGGGCLDASAELREFVQRTGVPVAATLMGLGAFPEDHDLALQVRWPCSGTLCWRSSGLFG